MGQDNSSNKNKQKITNDELSKNKHKIKNDELSKNKHTKNDKLSKNTQNITNNELSKKNQVIIGIDFGSCGITFAYAFLDDPKKQIFSAKFEEQGIDNKVSTEIILDEQLDKVLKFGNECNTYLSSIGDKKFHHFKNIKMNLYLQKYKIKSNNSGKEVDIQFIITKILIHVKDKAKSEIKKYHPNLEDKNIHWVITVPAIWDIKSKQIMINSAQDAGLIREDDDPSNFFALEPEAASIYYHNSPQGMKNKDIDSGIPFILLDLGSGTADIVTQKKVLNDKKEIKFEELYPPIGGDCGCNIINENFIDKVIKELFGKEHYEETKEYICNNKYYDWYEFEKKIEEFKKNFRNYEQLKSYFKIDCDIFSEKSKEKLEVLVEKFNNNDKSWKLKIDRGWKINFPYKI